MVQVFVLIFVTSCLQQLLYPWGVDAEWWWSRRRRRRATSCYPQNCQVSDWSSWGSCTYPCGNSGTRTRTRYRTVSESDCGICVHQLSQTQDCNRNNCQNGGWNAPTRCTCKPGFDGTCCEKDIKECNRNPPPCAHNCHNTHGSYTCSCRACYTKYGTLCTLEQCRIGGSCYTYNTVNPGNLCQKCSSLHKTCWTNDNSLPCNDTMACTRNDKCINGVCKGTSYTCQWCQYCDHDNGCKIKSGHCLIDVNGAPTCYKHDNLRPGYPCQQCNSNQPAQWTSNNALSCSDNNVKTRNDRCVNGACVGTLFTCLSCQEHYNNMCRLKSGYCVIKHNNINTCFKNETLKPQNPCQWCDTSSTTGTWTNRTSTVTCNDNDTCTRNDKCTNGQCIGTSFTCNPLCQYCDRSACSLKPGFGYVNGKCTCKIGDQNYQHQQLNPTEQCQWCDLYDNSAKATNSWSNKTSVSCNDDTLCTQQDTCINGRCVGVPYSCQSSYPNSSCIRTSTCQGNGTCKDFMRARNTVCRAAADICDRPEKCDGTLGVCPGNVVDPLTVKVGTVSTASTYQYITDKLTIKVTGFNTSCGAWQFTWVVLQGSAPCAVGFGKRGVSNSVTQLTITNLSLTDNQNYKVAVQLTDMRGIIHTAVCTNVVYIDVTKPQGGWVRDGSSKDLRYQSTKLIQATWGGFTTRHGVERYEWRVTYTKRGESTFRTMQSFKSVGLVTTSSALFASIPDGSKVISTVRAYTKAGLFTDKSSNGVIVASTVPVKEI